MSTRVAFLRGINVGGHRVEKAQLIELFGTAGAIDVRTFLASGNVICDLPDGASPVAHEARLEQRLAEGLGYAVPVFLRDAAAVREIAEELPFTAAELAEAGKPQVLFLERGVGADPASLTARLPAPPSDEQLVARGDQLYWLPRAGILDSTLDLDDLTRRIGPHTMRTHNTVSRLAAKFL